MGGAARVVRERVAASAGLPHAPGLDGVRALAVLAVLGYHLDLPWMGGGFLGVEVFFTLSGFLITQLLVAEVGRRGRVDIAAFALARGRRLVPALVACLAATALSWRFLLPGEQPGLRADALSSLLYVQNWHLVLAGVPYGAAFDRPSPLLHMWSLSVEGQLYVLWPLLFVGVLATWRRGWSALAAVGLAGVSAVLLALQYDADNSGLAYYATDGRASGFLVGAALALLWVPARWSRPLVPAVRDLIDVLGLVSLVALIVGFVRVSEFDDQLYLTGGFLRTGVLTGFVVLAASRHDGLLVRLLSGRVLGWFGSRSYGIYLYHWPIFALTRSDGPLLDLARLAITAAVAELSYRYLERPIRRARVLAAPGRAAVVAIAGCVVAVGVTGLLAATTPQPAGAAIAAPSQVVSGSPLADVPDPAPDGAAADPTTAAPPSTAPPTTGSPITAATPDPAPSPPAAAPGPAPGAALVVGDSIAAGSADTLRAELGSGTTVDAKVGRQFSSGVAVVAAWARAHPGPVVVDLGANGSIQDRDLAALLDAADGHRVVLVGVAVPRRWSDANNATLRAAAAAHAPDVVFVDWAALVAAHPGAIGPDGVHPTPAGRDALADAVAAAAGR
jgi:peptidoglycan/LPS O-acetylase OafA/YrhL